MRAVHRRIKGSYAVVALIAGHGLLAFRDPYGIRPLCVRRRRHARRPRGDGGQRIGRARRHRPQVERDVAPGEAMFIDLRGQGPRAAVRRRTRRSTPACSSTSTWRGPTRCMDGISVYQARLNLGETLAQRVISTHAAERDRRGDPDPRIEPAVGDAAGAALGKPYREGFVKNRYVGRTFIMPGQGVRKKSVRQKLNAIGSEFKGRNVLLVDDSIVRGTTRKRSCRWRATPAPQGLPGHGRAAGALSRTSTASTCRPTTNWSRTTARIEEIREFIGSDALIYQDVDGDEARRRARSTRSSTASRRRASTASTSPATSAPTTSTRWRRSAGAQGDEEERRATARAWRCRAPRRRPDDARATDPARRPAARHCSSTRWPCAKACRRAPRARTPRRCS